MLVQDKLLYLDTHNESGAPQSTPIPIATMPLPPPPSDPLSDLNKDHFNINFSNNTLDKGKKVEKHVFLEADEEEPEVFCCSAFPTVIYEFVQ